MSTVSSLRSPTLQMLIGADAMLRCLPIDSDELAHFGASPAGDKGQWIHERVASLACWCAAIGISVLTVYDADGYLGDCIEELVSVHLRRRPLEHLLFRHQSTHSTACVVVCICISG